MSVTVVLTASIVLQLMAAVVALVLIRVTGLRSPWVLLSAAMVFQAVRRFMTLRLWLESGQQGDGFLGQGLVSLGIAILMLAAVLLIRPLFEEIVHRRDEAQRVAARFKAMFSDHGAVMLLIDFESGEIVEANAGAALFYGLSRDDLVGRRVREFAASEESLSPGCLVPVDQLTAAGESVVESQCTRLELDGKTYVCAVLTDVTARVIAERRFADAAEELESLVEELQESNGLLEELNNELHDRDSTRVQFLATVSHELSTPLVAIIGLADVLRTGAAGDLNDEQRRQIELVSESASSLLMIVDQMLDIARIDSGHLELERTSFDVGPVVQGVVETLLPLAADRKLDLVLEGVESAGTLIGDRLRMEQILLNLVGNALKYTMKGRVVVNVRRPGARLVVTVEDTGCGIAPEHVERIFDDYVRVASRSGATAAGAGLGLAVSRRLARLMGGDITLKSVPDEGSVFMLSLPVH